MAFRKEDRVLVVIQGQTRAWELTADRIFSQVVDELGADLALCGGDGDVPHNPFHERAKYVWRFPELDDWTEMMDRAVGDSSWRVLEHPGGHLWGTDTYGPTQRSGALHMISRRVLRDEMERGGLIEEYDWVIITRSDWHWPVPHPDTRYLSSRHIHTLDGEHYGGVCDRHFVVPQRLLRRYLSIQEETFTDPAGLRRYLDQTMSSQGWEWLNVEKFLAACMKRVGLWRRVRYLPYVPILVRAADGPTAWSVGEYDEELGCYVKYPTERERSELGREFISDQRSWERFLAPIRGLPARRRLRNAYAEKGLVDPAPFPRLDQRVRLWLTEKVIRPAARLRARMVSRLGRTLRMIPGASRPLDARLRRISRRAREKQTY